MLYFFSFATPLFIVIILRFLFKNEIKFSMVYLTQMPIER